MHVTSITSDSWHRNFTINQLSEPIKPVYNVRPDERASQCRPGRWTVCGRELKVIMNNSGNVYKNTPSGLSQQNHAGKRPTRMLQSETFSATLIPAFEIILPIQTRNYRISMRKHQGGSQVWRFTRSQECHSLLTDYWHLETRKWNPQHKEILLSTQCFILF